MLKFDPSESRIPRGLVLWKEGSIFTSILVFVLGVERGAGGGWEDLTQSVLACG